MGEIKTERDGNTDIERRGRQSHRQTEKKDKNEKEREKKKQPFFLSWDAKCEINVNRN